MSFSFQQELRDNLRPDALRAIAGVLIGCVISAIGLVFFINPYGMVPGGVFGLSIVLHALLPNLQIGTYALLIQIPLILFSIFVLGGKLGFRSLIAAFTLPVLVNLFSAWSYPTEEALRALDPAVIAGGHLNLKEDLIVCTLVGGALVGVGTGLIIRQQASSGGSDIIAMLLHKFTRIRFATCMIMVDGTIVLAGLLVIGMGLGLSDDLNSTDQSWKLSCYSLITMYTLTRSMTLVINGAKDCLQVNIICSKEEAAVLRTWILNDIDRTATRLSARGLYSEDGKELLLMVVRNKELPTITDGVKQRAPESFVVVTDAYDAYGYRWKDLPDAQSFSIG